MNKAPTQVEIYSDVVVKREDPAFPEVEKYRALQAVGAPVVGLRDVLERNGSRYLVLEKAEPLSLDTREPAAFGLLLDHLAEFARARPVELQTTNWRYLEQYWDATRRLVSLASDLRGPIPHDRVRDCPAPDAVFDAYRAAVGASPFVPTHGDPGDSNLGRIGGRIVAFDLQLAWRGEPFRDLALRTGASALPWPAHLTLSSVAERFATTLGLYVPDPFRVTLLAGAIYGSYFEQAAVEDVITCGPASKACDWARVTLDRYVWFASQL